METPSKLLKIILAVNSYASAKISGVSMNPVLENGQSVIVVKQSEYKIGDILIYEYKNEGLLSHRLLKFTDTFGGRYFCKGDNSLRLEDISFDDIIGKIVIRDDPNNNIEFIEASLAMSKFFRQNGFNSEKTRTSEEFAKYSEKYLIKREDGNG